MLPFAYQAQAQTAQQTTQDSQPLKEKVKLKEILGVLKDFDVINLILVAIAVFAGSLYAMGRSKVKQVGELFMKAYDYTDDKRLSKEEREDLINRFLTIVGKKK